MPSAASVIVSRDAGGRWGSPRVLLPGGDSPVPSPDGRRVLTISKEGDLVTVPLPEGPPSRIVTSPRIAPVPGFIWSWSPDGRFIYYIGTAVDKRIGVWRVPAAGGSARLILRFDDPSRYLLRPWLKVHGNRLYLIRGDQQGDVWMTEILGRG
jgi:Tol biopolymer transport system component